jgi:hemolysin D
MKSVKLTALASALGARPRDYELEFLPAALEIAETPPSPVGRAVGATLLALFSTAVAWACIGSVDITATAPGKIVPSGRTKVIQPFELSVVRAIRVRDGQTVKAGDLLIDLDATMNAAELDHLRSDLVAVRLDAARLHAALSGAEDPMAEFRPPPEASPALVATQRQFLRDQIEEQRAKIAALDRQRIQREAELASSGATIKKIEALIPIVQQQVDIRKTLYEHETGSKLNYLDALRELVNQQQELAVQKSHYREVEAALAAIVETRAQAAAEFRRSRFDELTKAEQKAAGLAQDTIKAEQRTRLQQLVAPIDGVVQQLAVHTVGGIVTPAQPLLVLVPLDSQLEIEAQVPNRDIGFVHVGQPVEIKVTTFNFTRYGLLHGRVLNVSRDAVAPEKSRDQTGDKDNASERNDAPGNGQEFAYAARISMDRAQMQIDENLVDLSPGMAVIAEIRTGSRRIIEYLLSPLLKYQSDSLRER